MLVHGSVKGILRFFKSSWAHALCQAGVPVLGGQDHHAALDWGCNGGALFLKMIFQHAVPPACHTLPWASRCHVSGVHGPWLGERPQVPVPHGILFRLEGSRGKNPALGNKSYLKHLCVWLVDFGLVAVFL